MKKILVYFCFIITFIIIYFLQSNFFSWFTIAGIMPNLFIIFIVVIGMFAGGTTGLICGILFGILLDSCLGRSIGITSVMLGLVGYLGGYIDKNFSKEGRIIVMLVIAVSTFTYETGKYGIECLVYNMQFAGLTFLKILGIEVLYNIIISIILCPTIEKLGYKMENTLKNKNILTRYF